jgi:hypothetical protein
MNHREFHPYLMEGQIDGATKLILGSFPVYACTDPDNIEKQKIRNTEGTVRFFYGSCKSRFWGLYHQYVDNNVTVPVKKSIALESLKEQKIAMSDTIKSCYRKEASALDSDLRDIKYNTEMINSLIESGVTKVLCTSKGVLEHFNKRIISKLPEAKFNDGKTNRFLSDILNHLGGITSLIKKPICSVYDFHGREIFVLAIPSPGSPQRQAHSFGCKSNYKLNYAISYFEYAFKWIKK